MRKMPAMLLELTDAHGRLCDVSRVAQQSRSCSFQNLVELTPAPRSGVGMKLPPVAAPGDEAGADDELAEALAFGALGGIGGKQRIERRDDRGVVEVFGIELVQARSVDGGAEIEVVAAWSLADQTDLGQVGPRAAIRAAGHADDDLIIAEPMRGEPLFERGQEFGQVAFALGQREPTG